MYGCKCSPTLTTTPPNVIKPKYACVIYKLGMCRFISAVSNSLPSFDHFQDSRPAREAPGAWRKSRAGATLQGERLHHQDQSGRHSPPALRTVSSSPTLHPLLCTNLLFHTRALQIVSPRPKFRHHLCCLQMLRMEGDIMQSQSHLNRNITLWHPVTGLRDRGDINLRLYVMSLNAPHTSAELRNCVWLCIRLSKRLLLLQAGVSISV